MADTREQLSPVSVGLHWIIGLTMIGMAIFGIWMADLPKGDFKGQMVGLHKSIGVIVLLFAAWRLIRRLRIGMLVPVGAYAMWETILAKIVGLFLLLATVVIPLTGIAMTIAAARPLSVFGVQVLPQFLAVRDQAIGKLMGGSHELLGKLLLVVVALHIAGALKHHVVDKDGTLRRIMGARVTSTNVA
jgi:cytochrome b561